MGEFATIARKHREDWFIGSLTGKQEKSVQINLDFLNPSAKYKAIIYSHDQDSDSSTKVDIKKINTNSETIINMDIAPNSGLAIHLRKK